MKALTTLLSCSELQCQLLCHITSQDNHLTLAAKASDRRRAHHFLLTSLTSANLVGS